MSSITGSTTSLGSATSASPTINASFLYNLYNYTSTVASGSVTINLPTPSTTTNPNAGNILIIKFYSSAAPNSNSLNLIISGNIDGTAASTVNIKINTSTGFTGRAIVTLQSNGSTWYLTALSNY